MPAFALFKPQIISIFPSLAKASEPIDPTKPNWSIALAGILYAAMPLAFLWFRRRRHPASLEVDLPEHDTKTDKKPNQANVADTKSGAAD